MYLSEILPQLVGQWIEIYCNDGGQAPSSGKLFSVDGPILVLERDDQIICNKSYIMIGQITRFSVYPNYTPPDKI